MESIIKLFVRLAVSGGFLSAVADRFGMWGKPGDKGVAWGNWDNFLTYTSTLTFGAKGKLLDILAIAATAAEVLFGLLLIAGFKTKLTALGSGLLLLSFGIAMSVNTHLKSALDFSVFSAAGCCLLLYLHPYSKWSIDAAMRK